MATLQGFEMATLSATDLVRVVAAVMHREFVIACRKLQAEGEDDIKMPPLLPSTDSFYRPDLISASLVADCGYAAALIANAFSSVDADRYCARLQESKGTADPAIDRELRRYGRCYGRSQSAYTAPCTMVDKFGNILAWYLPNILTHKRQQFSANKPIPGESKPSWRRNEQNFIQPPNPAAPLGAPTFAPAWYPIGSPSEKPTTSATLSGDKRESGLHFLDEMAETNALMAAILSVIHPEQFQIGVRAHQTLGNAEPLREVLAHWPSCFTALQVINNRVSPLHTDPGAPYPAFDVIASIGDYTGGHIILPTLPVDFQQPPGSVLAFCARMLPHSVEKFVGDRISFAWFMKDRV
ncbi:hypothetical protein EVJ58_g10194, partial [Rhodofomes roseus]